MTGSHVPPADAQSPAGAAANRGYSTTLAASVLSGSEAVTKDLGEEQWESLYLSASTATDLAELDAPNRDWVAGLDPFVGGAIPPAQREDYDLWFRCEFEFNPCDSPSQRFLIFHGLATIADVWLNDQHILHSNNMFLRHNLNVDRLLGRKNHLYLRIGAMTPQLEKRRPRPKWSTAFAQHKNLAWFRTSLLGRIPTWSPPPPITGPWLPVQVIEQRLVVQDARFQCSLLDGRGVVEAEIELIVPQGLRLDGVQLQVGEQRVDLALSSDSTSSNQALSKYSRFQCELSIEGAEPWWPHTHGIPRLYAVRLFADVDGVPVTKEFDPVGFRNLEWRNLHAAATQEDGWDQDFGLSVNGVKIFCRGACWTPLQIHKPASEESQLRAALQELCDAGVNMLRVSGTFFYEQDTFYRLCDELGILVWQDFMFARLAYPFDDPDFHSAAITECRQILLRLRCRASLAMLCGNSEIEQQTAMLGLPLDGSLHCFFRETLANLCAEYAPHAGYWPSSPAGGALPFKITQGVSHCFGVGGYRRSLDDARVSTPKFASECLAFSNIPEHRGLAPFLPGQAAFPTHPDYKAGVPRDVSAGWDFADITDHYIERLFHLDTRALRHQDPERYYYLAKVCCGEVVSRVLAQWRCQSSPCNGALIWLLRDLQMGAGWGLIDAQGVRKSLYYYLKRVWEPLCLWFVDNGLDGLSLHLDNEKFEFFDAELELLRYQANGRVAAVTKFAVTVGRQQQSWNVEALLGQFFDSTYAYQFGPREFNLIQARLWRPLPQEAGDADPDGAAERLLAEAFYYPIAAGSQIGEEPSLEVWAEAQASGCYTLVLKANSFVRALAVNVYPFSVEDNYFDMAPGTERRLALAPPATIKPLRGAVGIFNGRRTYPICVRE